MTQPEDNFIGRWSRRKKEARSDQPPPAESTQGRIDHAGEMVEPDAGASTDNQHPAGDNDAAQPLVDEVLTDADMVDLDTLDADSDYTPFMSEGVSSELRKAALKKLFFSGKFAARDGLDDYDDDFTYFEPLGDTVTSDMKYHARRKEKERLAKLEEERLALEAQAEEPAGEADSAEANDADANSATNIEASETPGDDAAIVKDNAGEPDSSVESDGPANSAEPKQPQHASFVKSGAETKPGTDTGESA